MQLTRQTTGMPARKILAQLSAHQLLAKTSAGSLHVVTMAPCALATSRALKSCTFAAFARLSESKTWGKTLLICLPKCSKTDSWASV